MKNTIIALKRFLCAIAAFGIFTSSVLAQNFRKVYDALPDMTLDQAYSALFDFQKANPYLSAVYIQLGDVCEKKMIMFDPLRETESIRFWSQNAELFYGNLKVYYSDGDVRTEFYENLHIPFAGKKITDADLWSYVEQHKQKCKNIADTTSLIYSTIESSRLHYNKSIEAFKSICNDYQDRNEMLLRYDAPLAARLDSLKWHASECERQFAEYKRLTKLYPIANYTQRYEKVPIETFRLDGLTNSDFFENRFNIWDYTAWIADFQKTFNSQIKPLRDDVAKINNAYMSARAEFDAGRLATSASTKPYDENFLFRLGHFDVGSAVDPLFDYLDATREMIVLAGDSLGRNFSFAPGLENRKMRRLSRLVQQSQVAAQKRQTLIAISTKEKLARFADLFVKQYGGVAGMKSFVERDAQYCQSIINQMNEATADYIRQAAQFSETDVYSTPNGAAAPSVPLWVAFEPQSVTAKFISTHVVRNARGQVAAAAGYVKGNAQSWFVAGISPEKSTQWLLRLKGVNSINNVALTSDGILISAIRQLKPVVIFIDNQGKEQASISSNAEFANIMDRDGVTGSTFWVAGNDQSLPTLSKASDGSAAQDWTSAISGITKVYSVNVVADGFILIGSTPTGGLATVHVSADGVTDTPKVIAADVADVVATQRVSSSEMAALVKLSSGKHQYIPFSIGQ